MPHQKVKPGPSSQPQDVPLPQTPPKSGKSRGKKVKGKAKQDNAPLAARAAAGPNNKGSESGEDAEGAPWQWTSLTDSSPSSQPPLFTKDGSYFFSIVGSSVKIHSTLTGQVVSTLSAPSASVGDEHTDTITSFVLNPSNPFQLITASLDGNIKVWDFVDAALLQTIALGQPIYYICAHQAIKDHVFVAAAKPGKKKSSGQEPDDAAVVIRVSLTPTSQTASLPVHRSSDIQLVGKTRYPRGIALSPSGAWLVAIGGHKAYVAQTSALKAGFTKFVSPDALTCLAFHPEEEYFATGDVRGMVRLWYCLTPDTAAHAQAKGVEKRAQTTTLHWHAHAVAALSFAPNGAYLLSGGEESVLVIWQLQSGRKEFVPRMGAPIANLAVCRAANGREEEYLLGLTDASFAFVSAATMKISRTYSRIKLNPVISSDMPSTSAAVIAPLAVHGVSSTLILPSSHPSTLQTYSPSTSALVAELEVSPSNRVSRRDSDPIVPSAVEHAVLAPSGDWLATVDRRPGDDAFRGEAYLKLWRWSAGEARWVLNTRVDRPHGLGRVTGLTFSPSGEETLVTTGEDGQVKTWRVRRTKEKGGEIEDFWILRSTFTYRSMAPTHVCWSPDGSLLAITFGACVAIFDPVSNVLQTTITCAECPSASEAHFIGSSGRYILVFGPQDLTLWDLVRQSSCWHYRSTSAIDAVVPHPRDDTFVVLQTSTFTSTESTDVRVFSAASAKPVRIRCLPFRLRSVVWDGASSSTGASTSFTLVGITQTWGVALFGDEIHAPAAEGSVPQGLAGASTSTRRTLFQDIFGVAAFGPMPAEDAGLLPRPDKPWSANEAMSVFDAPAYMMPPIDTVFDSLLDTFLRPRTEESGQEEEVDVEMEDPEEREDDSEQPVLGERVGRVVDDEEVEALTLLFKEHALKPTGSRTSVNGVASKLNGTTPVRTPNGKSATAATIPTSVNGKHTPKTKSVDPAPETPTSPAAAGKKRKKSSA